MSISDKTRKTLWGRAANRCAICKRELIINATEADDESVIGEECHIVSGATKGPRCDPSFPKEKLDDYDNLILLCKIHHKMVDDQKGAYTADGLKAIKRVHELWVKETLGISLSGQAEISVSNARGNQEIFERDDIVKLFYKNYAKSLSLDAIKINILKFMVKHNDPGLQAPKLAKEIGILEIKVQYHLDKLVEQKYLTPLLSYMEPTKYLLTEKARAFLVEEGII